ncbi:MAG: aminotransferase class I/II-fold pyridoxal phosphate-dependent enzyme, partial [Pseudomonadota bacterium]
TDAGGKQALKEALSAHYQNRYGVQVDPFRIVVTTGSSAGFTLAFLASLDVGARVAIARPGYPAYRNIIAALGLEVVEIETHQSDRHRISPAMLEAAGPLDAILVASPANPTGTMLEPQALRELLAWCEGQGVRFISDEIYHGLTYAGAPREVTALATSDQAIIVNSFSKYFCMTGWRVGWLVLPEHLVRPVERLAQSLFISAPDLSQTAALHALNASEELERVKQGYAANRDLLMKRLPELGFRDIAPVDGAFYIYADAGSLTKDTMHFAHDLLDRERVAITPGADFDPQRGGQTVRFSFAGSSEEMVRALDGIERYLA